MPVTVYPTGVTLYDPERCCNGYSLLSLAGKGNPRWGLVDMNGEVAWQWELGSAGEKGGVPRVRLLPDGRLLVLRTLGLRSAGFARLYDWDGNLIFEHQPADGLWPHHDIETTADGNLLLICRETVPEAIRSQAKEPQRRAMLYADVLQEVSLAGEVVWEWHQYEHLDIDLRVKVPAPVDWWAGPENNTLVDWTHTNTIQALPENKWHAGGDQRFKPGNLLMSLRQLDLLLIVDRETKEIVWQYSGDYKGGLSGQHDSHMIEPGLPGAGNILVFDNGASPTTDLSHAGSSFVLEIDPTTQEVVWVYDQREAFHSNFTSSCQRLANGNTLILEAAHHRLFEVTPSCETVWEYVFPRGGHAQRAYRYGYDFCPQMASLPRPVEQKVTPLY